MPSAPGFYGKVPALGDFLSRRIPPGFLAAWDGFLGRIVLESRASLGADWLAAWNEAPVWHFGLGAGVAGPERWFGVLIPSIDRVGRHFPFSILGPEAATGIPYAEWSLRIEPLALGVLDDGFDAGNLDAALRQLAFPAPPSSGSLTQLPAGTTSWSCRPTSRMPATARSFAGLPDAGQSATFVAPPPS